MNETTAIGCEGYKLSLICPIGQSIVINYANYGRTDTTTCGITTSQGSIFKPNNFENINCKFDALSILRKFCANQNNCTFIPSNSIFKEACSGTYKYLKVIYKCELKNNKEETKSEDISNLSKYLMSQSILSNKLVELIKTHENYTNIQPITNSILSFIKINSFLI